ncbi:Cadherin-1 [Anabarilius grahami]|uniref:Cadherin-1 n=1 Tax=Anabarilius grahami TaxID=495550 RepID=A0A3N0XTL8_ANAGA|nr:Cadherin-1 [Anabarilius grahami]
MPEPPAVMAATSEPPAVMAATSEPSAVMAAIPEPPALTDTTPESPAFTGASPESSAIMDATSVFLVVMNVAHEAIKAARSRLRLASSLLGTPLMLMRAASISVVVSSLGVTEVVPLTTAFTPCTALQFKSLLQIQLQPLSSRQRTQLRLYLQPFESQSVIFNACDGRTRTLFQSSDKRFDVNTDGTVTLKRQVTLHEGHKVFSVHAWDSSGKKHTVSVRVERVHHHEDHHMDTVMNISSPQMESPSNDLVLMFPKSSTGLKRAKRGWVIPPFNVLENSRGPFPIKLVQIKSDYSREAQMQYRITGEGADLDPKGTFTIERLSGNLFVTRPLDRERKASYRIIAHATGVDVNIAEKPFEIIVNVLDQNDNKPVFTQNPFNGNVPEAADKGHEFMTVTATDADDPETDNAEIRYSIVKQEPESPNPNMFEINSVTGGIRVNSLGLDREVFLCGFAEGSSCTPGFESELLVFKVHRDHLHQGTILGRVIFNACDGRTRTLFQSSDERFDVNTDGTVRLKRQVTLHEGHKVFSVHAWDSSGKKHTVSVRVERVHHHEDHHMDTVMNISSPQMESPSDDLVLTFPKSSTGLKRAKRGWVIPPISLLENNRGPFPMKLVQHTVSVPENKVRALVANLTVTDGDEEGSPAWSTKYRIISGDKDGFFSVSTGPSQLEGIITTVKPLDFEKNKQYNLSVIVENDDPFVGSLATSTATVTVNVEDVNDPPEFNPKEKIISTPEDSPVDTELVTYTATDPDIEKSQKIMYKIGNDPDGWLSVNQDTGLIKVRKPMDRESPHVKDGKYTAIIRALDYDGDAPPTGTGTLIIELSDVNDNAPVINERNIMMCNRGSAPVLLSITDKDDHPFAGPFTVETQGETSKNWSVTMNESCEQLLMF